MAVVVVTGSAGLVGSEASLFFAGLGFDIVGIDNDLRRSFFGDHASTSRQRRILEQQLGKRYRHVESDIRDDDSINKLFKEYGTAIVLVIHAAAQPSHDWAAREPVTDFSVNALGTLKMLEATRCYAPGAVFIFCSTNKVYGDTPNRLPLIENAKRWEIDPTHPNVNGIREDMRVDQCLHSLFGVSKLAADVMVQEYGRYFGMQTCCFRGGCLTGPNHAGAQLHGFLAYLMKCTVTGEPYTVFGYKGKQVRDNIHSADLVRAFYQVYQNPRFGEVYNIGGGRYSNCSMLEAIELCEEIVGRELKWTYADENRVGDHIWYISNLTKFMTHYPEWRIEYSLPRLLRESYEANCERWMSGESK